MLLKISFCEVLNSNLQDVNVSFTGTIGAEKNSFIEQKSAAQKDGELNPDQ